MAVDPAFGRKLVVEVCNANNLMPKDGQGTASAYVMVDFEGQRRRTKTKFRDLNPAWDEKLEFSVQDKDSMVSEILELNVYNDKKMGKRSTFLGKVKISGSTFSPAGSETLVYYPLEKRSVFSQIKGEIGLKVCYVDDLVAPPPPEKEEKASETEAPPAEEKPKEEEKKTEEAVLAAADEKKPDEKAAEEKPPEEKTAAAEKPPEEKVADPLATPPPPPPPVTEEQAPLSQTPQKPRSEKTVILAEKAENSISAGMERRTAAFDLVDKMPFLYVRVVKAKLINSPATSYANLVIGTHSIKTNPRAGNDIMWDQVFAFDKESLNSTSLEIAVWSEGKTAESEAKTESCIGTVSFDLAEVPKRVPPDSPLAPQWYSLESGVESSPGNDVMLSVWLGTQADEAFQEAWQSDSGGLIPETRAKVYLSPKLWYLRLTVIQTQDLQLGPGSGAGAGTPEPKPQPRNPELYVKAKLGPQLFKTSKAHVVLSSSAWNEDLIFVAAEPFEPFLLITVEDAANGGAVGFAKVQLASIDKRGDDKTEPRSRWFNLTGEDEKAKPYAGRIHVRLCLEGGYHVIDEAAHVTSDVRPTAKQLSRPPIGLLEVGIRGGANLLPVKTRDGTRGTTDGYVVAKYGPKWVRTRTILDRFNPRWNEQYTWDVYDPCTVLTIGAFDNGRYKQDEHDKKDVRLGKLRVRLSTLDTNRVYMGTYPLMVLLPTGPKKMGDIEIAFRFSCPSWISLIQIYTNPTLPRMHYIRPFGPAQQDILRHTAMKIVTARLARSEPALGPEVVQFILDSDTHMWSMRRSKANWFRVIGCLSRAAAFAGWIHGIRTWTHPPTTVLVHILLVSIVLCPHLILPAVFMYCFLIVGMRFRYRKNAAITIDGRLSHVDAVGADELDEEFDGFPTSRPLEQIRGRYDRLRALAGRAQTLLGDVAAQGERLEALFNWRDPRATGIFVVVCFMASLVFYVVPFKVLVLGCGFFYFRHPRFRDDMPSVPMNFFRRLPPLSDQIL